MSVNLNCPGSKIRFQGNLLNRSLLMPQEFWMFARPWLLRARRAGFTKDEPFGGLIYLWVTFNAWVGQIIADRTMVEDDWYLVEAAGCDEKLGHDFQRLITEDPGFESIVSQFAELWPIFKVRALLDKNLGPWKGTVAERPRYRYECFTKSLKTSDFAPRCFQNHQPDPTNPKTFSPSNVPIDWPHTLSAIYRVRCNLFHGGKSFVNSGDRIFVQYAFLILWRVWGESQSRHHAP